MCTKQFSRPLVQAIESKELKARKAPSKIKIKETLKRKIYFIENIR
jgi:hypothetical protein